MIYIYIHIISNNSNNNKISLLYIRPKFFGDGENDDYVTVPETQDCQVNNQIRGLIDLSRYTIILIYG